MSIPVPKEDFKKYCVSRTYNGSLQYLTSDPPENVTFNNRRKDVHHEKLSASINAPIYIWDDGTFEDIPFNCPMSPLSITVQAKDQSKVYDGTLCFSNFPRWLQGSDYCQFQNCGSKV